MPSGKERVQLATPFLLERGVQLAALQLANTINNLHFCLRSVSNMQPPCLPEVEFSGKERVHSNPQERVQLATCISGRGKCFKQGERVN